MNSKKAKQQRRLAKDMAKGKPPDEAEKIYKRLKKTHKAIKGEI